MHGLVLTREAQKSCPPPRREWLRGVTREAAEPEAERLIRAIAVSRNREAFTVLFQRFAPRVKAYLIRLGLDNRSAEEATQDVMLALWGKAGQFNPARSSAAAWIFSIARNTRIDLARRQQRAPKPEPLGEVASDPVPDTELAAADRAGSVAMALAALPAEQAAVIRLAFFDDRSHAEIERALGIPLGTVKSRLRLALLRLRGLLENDL